MNKSSVPSVLQRQEKNRIPSDYTVQSALQIATLQRRACRTGCWAFAGWQLKTSNFAMAPAVEKISLGR
jgi:hypothetical protein